MALDAGVREGITNMGYVARNAKANQLTIPQLKKAIELLKSKQEGASEEVKNKLGAEIVSFQIAQEKLARFAEKMRSGTPQMQEFIRGKKDMYTIAQLRTMNEQTTGGLNRTYQFGVGGFMHELGKQFDMKKIALGVGIAALGLGVAGMVTQAITGQGLFAALGSSGALAAVGTFLTANPAALAAVIAGVTLIVARKVLPKIARAVKAHNANRRAMRETQLDLDELADKERSEKEDADLKKEEEDRLKGRTGSLAAEDFGDNFAANKDKLVQALVDYGPLSDDVLKNWTTTQKSNYYTALKEAKDKKKELDDKISEVDGTAQEKKEEDDKKKKEEEDREKLRQIALNQLNAALKNLPENLTKEQADQQMAKIKKELGAYLTEADLKEVEVQLKGRTISIDLEVDGPEDAPEDERELWTPEQCAAFVKKTPKQFIKNALDKALKAKTITQDQYDMMLAMGMQK